MEFKKSSVVFNAEDHTYFLGDKQLMGITGLIHSILGLGIYPDASNYTADYIIPRAGSRGTAVHHAIQMYDEIGIRHDRQTVRTRFGCRERNNITYEDLEWDVTNELDAYIRHLEFFIPLANELTVSDNERYASQIDNVWQNKQTDGIWLVDTKTNNIIKYPTCGYFNKNFFTNGKDALKEYLSWQLSIYAYLFERENPGLNVEGLACNWLREDEAEFWVIERKDDSLVEELLKTEWSIIDGNTHYYHADLSVFGIEDVHETLPAPAIQTLPDVPRDVVEYVTSLILAEKELKTKMEEAKAALRKAMETHGVKSFDFGTFNATIAADSEKATFETRKFKEEHPDLYEQYCVRKTQKGSFTLRAKE